MEFFNKKEDVIRIELTPRGKELLAMGKWNPTHYTFHDDDILYDSQYANISESVKDVADRIDGTERMRPHGKETYGLPIGNSSTARDYAPSWNVVVKEGYISESYTAYTASNGGMSINIPQLDMVTSEYKTKLTTIDSEDAKSGHVLGYASGSDTTVVAARPDDIYVTLSEHNIDVFHGGYEIELYEVEDGIDNANNAVQLLRRLSATEVAEKFEIMADGEIADGGVIILDSTLGAYGAEKDEDECKI